MHTIVERRARQRVRHGHTNVIGFTLAHELERILDVSPGLTRIAELQEEADEDVGVVQAARCFANLGDGSALFHRIEDPL